MLGGITIRRLLAVGVLALMIWYFKVLALLFYWVSMKLDAEEWQDKSLWLPGYRVSLEAIGIEGIEDNASGLTFNPLTGTLYSVINSPPAVAELSTEGKLLRLLPLSGAKDPEGITHVEEDLFIIADERDNQLIWVRISPEAEALSLTDAPRLGIGIDMIKNLGFEGVSWDHHHERLFIVQEKWPLRVLVVTGLQRLLRDGVFNLQLGEWKSAKAASLFMSDLSSLTLHEPTGNLLMLSHESALIVEYAPSGKPISIMPLWGGVHGLSRRIPQAEGLAVGPDGSIYVLSEPNLFYRFERRQP